MFSRIIVAILLIACALGCGGGGGGGTSGPSVTYLTDWSHAGQSGPTGASQKVRLLKLDDTDAVAPVVLVNGSSHRSFKFKGFPAGTYRLRAELRSVANGTGAINGVSEQILTITTGVSVKTAVGTDATSVQVSPASASIVTPGSARFAASGRDSGGSFVFLAPDAFSWGVTGPATVSTDGIVVPSGLGSGSVTATLGALNASGQYSATTSTPTTSKWTVLVYMNAANNLDQFAAANVDQMERIADNPDVRFVVQWKEAEAVDGGATFTSTKRYLIAPDQGAGVVSPMVEDMGSGVDMGSKQTLRDFIAWGKANYPATRSCVVVWDHGNGWKAEPFVLMQPRGVSYDGDTGNHIDTADLPFAFGPDKLDIVAWDSSLMQMLEVAYEIRNQAFFVVGSEESPPGQGYPYDVVFNPMHDNPDGSTHDLTKGFIDGMVNDPSYVGQKLTESSIDTSHLGSLASALDALGLDLISNSGSFPSVIDNARNTAQAYLPLNGRVYRDLYDLCTKIEAGAGVPSSTITACQTVQAAVLNSLAWEGHSAQSANSHGISIDFSSATQFPSGSAEYNALDLSNDTSWNEWLVGAP